ncbi:MAG: indole-3-glycerol-phosphate synthase [Methanophagales archaeon]|nr:indole-3-glycerol-phosphate synthase [Methanophagales archaeon]
MKEQRRRKRERESRADKIPERACKVLSLSDAITNKRRDKANRDRDRDRAIIGEIKPRSPRDGDLIRNRDVSSLAGEYEEGGAAAISVLTSHYFGGSLDNLAIVKKRANIPVLHKDFIVDEYQILEGFGYGADAVLLIEGISPVEELLNLVDDLELEAVIECHSVEEIEKAVNTGAKLIGINNRNLKTFTVDLETTARLAEYVPADRILISESGVRTVADVRYLFDCGADAILIGTTLMRATNPVEFIRACVTT